MHDVGVCRELLTFLDMAYHYGSDRDKRKAEKLQVQLLQDDTKEAGVLNRVLQSMRQFKKHDKKVPRQEGRESRGYAVDMVKMLHVVLRVYERICKSGFVVQREPMSNAAAQDEDEDSEDDKDYKAGSEDNATEGTPYRGETAAKADVDSWQAVHSQGEAVAAGPTEDVDAVEQPSTPRASPPAGNEDADSDECGAAKRAGVSESARLEDELSDDEEGGGPKEKEKSKKPKVSIPTCYLPFGPLLLNVVVFISCSVL